MISNFIHFFSSVLLAKVLNQGGFMNYRSFLLALHIPLLSMLIPLKAWAGGLAGTYQMAIRIGEHDFVDILVLKGDRGLPVRMHSIPITGTLEVPGVFVADLRGNSFCSGPWTSMCKLSFAILARENGQEFIVNYEASLANYYGALSGAPAILEGSATLENGDLLGNFTATQQLP